MGYIIDEDNSTLDYLCYIVSPPTDALNKTQSAGQAASAEGIDGHVFGRDPYSEVKLSY